ncbi:hypothetical protein C8J56DRAFT_1043434 [Mycena floridula]|nr:hypothetical protein C8J56DRAFT_1043434 [Mycena floridula]
MDKSGTAYIMAASTARNESWGLNTDKRYPARNAWKPRGRQAGIGPRDLLHEWGGSYHLLQWETRETHVTQLLPIHNAYRLPKSLLNLTSLLAGYRMTEFLQPRDIAFRQRVQRTQPFPRTFDFNATPSPRELGQGFEEYEDKWVLAIIVVHLNCQRTCPGPCYPGVGFVTEPLNSERVKIVLELDWIEAHSAGVDSAISFQKRHIRPSSNGASFDAVAAASLGGRQ